MPKLFLLLVLIAFVSCGEHSQRNVKDRPNVIIILTDDQGYADVGFNGCRDIPTPNIDRIAKNGVRFTNAYVTYSVCGPSRAGLITGRYQDRFGFSRNPLFAPKDSMQGVPRSEEMLSEALKRADYKTIALGKWHLGSHETLRPLNRGFDEFFGFLSGGHRYFPSEWTLNDLSEVTSQFEAYRTKLLRNDTRVTEQSYLTDALSREAVEFVQRNENEPFFLYLAYNAPHYPLQATEKYLSRFAHINNEKRRTYAAMVSAVDDGVGQILDQLQLSGIEDNSIVFFLSDNGGPEKKNGSNNGLLRDGKGSLYEGGVRVPFAMQWTGEVQGSMDYNSPISSLDIFSTAIAYSGVSSRNKIDGVNLVDFVTGKNKEAPHEALFWRKFDEAEYAIRSGDHKMVVSDGVNELFDVSVDLSEEEKIENDSLILNFGRKIAKWNQLNQHPVFDGLLQNQQYNSTHPNRFFGLENY